MSRDHSTPALTHEEHRLVTAAEQDLDRILSIQPSPEFAARIRARILAADRPARWYGRWTPAAASIVVIAGIAVAIAELGDGRSAPMGAPATAARTAADISLRAATVARGPAGVLTERPSRSLAA
ncbi:MAG: hypothetical protein ABJC89_02315, partial [Acidobacteriota bacterium]